MVGKFERPVKISKKITYGTGEIRTCVVEKECYDLIHHDLAVFFSSTRSLVPRSYKFKGNQSTYNKGRGGDQVVSVLAFYSYNPSSNPADFDSFSVNFAFEKNENKQKETGNRPF